MSGPASRSAKQARLSHADARGQARMVDVAVKPETLREAVASAAVRMLPATLRLVERGAGARDKGDVLAVARIAGVMAAKRTAELIPLCHPVRLVRCTVDIVSDRALPGVRIKATARAVDRTGVEMEAMVAASVAALTVYDMVKGVERGVEIDAVRLEAKSGGRSGSWVKSPEGSRRAKMGFAHQSPSREVRNPSRVLKKMKPIAKRRSSK